MALKSETSEEKVIRYLSRAVEFIVVIAMAVVVAVVTTEVVMRYIFLHSLIITEELSRYLMVWIVFLGSALVIKDGEHIRISVFVNRLSPERRPIAELISHLFVLAFLAVVIVEGTRILPRVIDQYTTTLEISIFWFYLAIPCGSALMALFLLRKVRRLLTKGFADQG